MKSAAGSPTSTTVARTDVTQGFQPMLTVACTLSCRHPVTPTPHPGSGRLKGCVTHEAQCVSIKKEVPPFTSLKALTKKSKCQDNNWTMQYQIYYLLLTEIISPFIIYSLNLSLHSYSLICVKDKSVFIFLVTKKYTTFIVYNVNIPTKFLLYVLECLVPWCQYSVLFLLHFS